MLSNIEYNLVSCLPFSRFLTPREKLALGLMGMGQAKLEVKDAGGEFSQQKPLMLETFVVHAGPKEQVQMEYLFSSYIVEAGRVLMQPIGLINLAGISTMPRPTGKCKTSKTSINKRKAKAG